MTNYHAIRDTWDLNHKEIFAKEGIIIEEGNFSWVSLSEEQFERLNGKIKWDWYTIGSHFTEKDRKQADFLVVDRRNMRGYPEPDLDYRKASYDMSEFCHECGIGLKQNNPIRIASNPVFKTNKLLSLHWIYDELFSEIEYYNTYIKPFGIGYRDVILHRSSKVSDKIIQLDIPTIDLDLDIQNIKSGICPVCKRKKYSAQFMGYFPAYDNTQNLPKIFKTKEYFGLGGHGADHWIVLSQELRQVLVESKGLYRDACRPMAKAE